MTLMNVKNPFKTLSSRKKNITPTTLHSSHFNYNQESVPKPSTSSNISQTFSSFWRSRLSRPRHPSSTLVGTSSPGPSNASSVTIPFRKARIFRMSELQYWKVVGEGAFGQVFITRDRVTTSFFAVKVVKKQKQRTNGCEMLLKEQRALRRVAKSPWFMSIDASWNDSNFFYFLMPYYRGGDLESEIRRCSRLEPARARFYIAEIIVALNVLHGLGIIHRDLKPANILFDNRGHIVLGDFGLAKQFGRLPSVPERVAQPYWPFHTDEEVGPATPFRDPKDLTFVAYGACGTPLTMAPEVIVGGPYSFGVDYWSAAATLYWMLVGRPPWTGCQDTILRRVLQDSLHFYEDDHISPDAQDFLESMLKKNPSERLPIGISMESHSFFAGVDWVKLERRETTPPWVPPPPIVTMVSLRQAPTFVPGTPYEPGEDPFPEFAFTSERIQTGNIDESEKEFILVGSPSQPPSPFHRKFGAVKMFFNDLVPSIKGFGSSLLSLTPSRSGKLKPFLLASPNPSIHVMRRPPGMIRRMKGWAKGIWVPEARRREGPERRLNLLE